MSFLHLLKSKPVLLLDGAMGTQLDKKGLMGAGRNNLDASQAVLDIHQAYARCGCDALTTNTPTMNRIYIETHKVDVSVQEVTDRPILAQPNAGKPLLVEGKTVFDMPPALFAKGILECIQAGAQIVGGCCGTGPEHIQAVQKIIHEV